MPEKKKKPLRCYKCLVTLERLKKDKLCDFLTKIVKENGEEDYICRVCAEEW